MTPPLRRGDFVTIDHEGRKVSAMVTLASGCGRSIVVMFDAMIGGWVQVMPLSETSDTRLETIGRFEALDGMKVTLMRRTREELDADLAAAREDED